MGGTPQLPPIDQTEATYWQMLFFRGLRAAFWGGVTTTLSTHLVLNSNFSNVKLWAISVGTAFTTGFGVALGKFLRDRITQGDDTKMIDKLPI